MDIINKNPYRYLGVYSNSPTKERVANKAKMNAFLKVGKPVSFPLDLLNILPSIDRSIETVANAESELTLPIDQIRFAQFWWMNVTPLDGIAFNHLTNGNMDMAKSIWEKKNNVSSLQNRFLLSIINNDWNSAIQYAENLYTNFSEEFIIKIIGEEMLVLTPLWQMFIDSLAKSGVSIQSFMDILTNTEWKNYIAEITIVPLIDSIKEAIGLAKSSKGKGSQARFRAGEKLMASTKSALSQIKKSLPTSDIRYQTIVDKLAIEILQCGIDYYNDSDEDDCTTKAMKLQKYAYSIAVGPMAKQRCKENVDILQKIIDELPPLSVMAQYKSIQEELRKYCQLPDKICHAITLLNSTKPHLDEMKSIIGSSNSAYIKLSTQVVDNALHNIIEEVNDVQKDETVEIQGRQIPISLLLDRDAKINSVKSTLREAWKATLLMDKFDIDPDFKTGRYMENKRILKNMCDQLGITTSSYSSTTSTTRRIQPPKPSVIQTPSSSSKSESISGCFVAIVLVIIGGAIGGAISGGGGAVAGAIIGFVIWSKFQD